jgi:acyl carrier protein
MNESGGSPEPVSEDVIRDWLRRRLAEEIDNAEAIDAERPLADYGVDSIAVVGVTGDLEDWLGVELDPTMFFDHPTLDQLAAFLLNEQLAGR